MTLPPALAELAADAGPFLDPFLDPADPDPSGHPSWDDLFELRRFLELGLTDLMAGREPEPGPAPLRLTKGRVRTTAICPAQVLGEVNTFGVNFNIAVGIVCDAAAGILALHPGFRPTPNAAEGWYRSLRPSLAQEHQHLTEFVDELTGTDRADFDHVVDDLCGTLPELVGDLRTHRPIVHHRIAHVPIPGVQITGEVDISCDFVVGGSPIEGRVLAEVKSGRFNPRIADELAHYGLITALQRLPDDPAQTSERQPPMVIGCSISLGDLAVIPMTLSLEVLETSARRLLDTAKGLLAIDETMRLGGRPPTNPGDHCRWCRRVSECGDAPDLVMAEVNESLRPLDPHRFDLDFDDAAVNDEFEGDDDTVGGRA